MSKYYNLKVKDIVRETSDTITVHLKQPLFSKIKYAPGQFLTLIVAVNGSTYRRAYSLSSAPGIDADLAVTIKRVENGIVSNHINDHLKVGDRLEIMEPIGNFKLVIEPKAERHIVLFGAGSGVTPLMSIARTVLKQEPKSMVSLVYGNRNAESVIFAELLEQMERNYAERFRVIHTFSRPEPSRTGPVGRLDKAFAADVISKLPKVEADTTEYFMCGPEGMMDGVTEALQEFGTEKAHIHRESFVSNVNSEAKKDAGSSDRAAQEITLIHEEEEYKLTVEPSKTILESALDAGIDVPYSCQSGLCTACRGKCHTGAVKMAEDEGLSESEIKEGYILTCVAYPLTNNVAVEIG